MEERVVERFLKYIKIDTESSTTTGVTPSTVGQMEFSRALAEELEEIGLVDITLDSNGYLMATLPSNIDDDKDIPTIGFIAHVDTSPDLTGKDINPQFVESYDGGDIQLSSSVTMSVAKFPDLKRYIGERLIVTDGTTLLGADDKAGIAEIITAVEYLIQNPEIKHGKVRIGFTPDEEIGAGADMFSVEQFDAKWAYTVDGGEIGELECENFNAASAVVKIHGVNVHPGAAKDKMVNSIGIANRFATEFPVDETPETTTGREGFYHLMGITGGIELTTLTYIIRDHDKTLFQERKAFVAKLVEEVNLKYGEGVAEVEISDSYYNMGEKIEPVSYIVDIAEEAMLNVGVKPIKKAIRGGTDGARLSFMGLPCPNIFGGGHNFHGRFEYVPTKSMKSACDVILEIIDIVAKR